MRRAACLAFAALLVGGCAEDPGPRFEHGFDRTPGTIHLDADACTSPARSAATPLTSTASATRLRNITDARADPARLGLLHDAKDANPVVLLQDPHDPADLALGRRVARSLAAPQMPDLVVADLTLREAWVESRGGTTRASFAFSVVPVMLAGRRAPVEFRGSASANDAPVGAAQSAKHLQAAFCDATNKFEAWLATQPRG